MTMELETINKLYLELSQVATAKTWKDIKSEQTIAITDNLAMLCIRLARALPDGHVVKQQAIEYLNEHELMPYPLHDYGD